MTERPLRIVFFMLHAGYIRFHRPVLEALAARGHEIRLAFTRGEKDPGDERLAEELVASLPRASFEQAPLRARDDPWRPFAGLVRGLVDLARYVDPRYADAPALRGRMAEKIGEHVRTAGGVDPVSRRVTLAVISFLSKRSSGILSRVLIRAFAAIERSIPTSEEADEYLRAHRPDVVVVTPLIEFASTQVEYVKSARKLGIPCALAVASWDNLTGKGLIRVVPDRVLVWNDEQIREAVALHGVPRSRVIATGAPKFDEWFERRPSTSGEEFARKAGLDSARPFVLYVCSSPFIARDEVTFVRRWLGALRGDSMHRDAGVLVRPHPQNAAQWENADLSEFANVSVWPRTGAQPDAGTEARADYFDSLTHSAAVVGINTSALIEAAIVGRSVLTVLAEEFAGTQSGTLHFHYLRFERGGFLHVADTLPEHVAQLRSVLERGDEHAAQTRRFIRRFVRPRGLERPAAPVAADAIEQLARGQTL